MKSKKTFQKGERYSALCRYIINQKGQVLFMIDEQDSEPDNPVIYFDGDKMFLLHKNESFSHELRPFMESDYKKNLKILRSVKKVLIVEEDYLFKLARYYVARFEIDPSIREDRFK